MFFPKSSHAGSHWCLPLHPCLRRRNVYLILVWNLIAMSKFLDADHAQEQSPQLCAVLRLHRLMSGHWNGSCWVIMNLQGTFLHVLEKTQCSKISKPRAIHCQGAFLCSFARYPTWNSLTLVTIAWLERCVLFSIFISYFWIGSRGIV